MFGDNPHKLFSDAYYKGSYIGWTITHFFYCNQRKKYGVMLRFGPVLSLVLCMLFTSCAPKVYPGNYDTNNFYHYNPSVDPANAELAQQFYGPIDVTNRKTVKRVKK